VVTFVRFTIRRVSVRKNLWNVHAIETRIDDSQFTYVPHAHMRVFNLYIEP